MTHRDTAEHDRQTTDQTAQAKERTAAGTTTGTSTTVGEVLELQRAAGNRAVSDAIVQRRALGNGVAEASSGSGSSLPAPLRSKLEAHVGAGLSDVRVHSGGAASRSAAQMGAQAYTVGNDIVLGQGAPEVSTPAGMHLLAHEATHVVQQRRGPVAGTAVEDGLAVSDPGDHFERAAEQSAEEFSRSRRDDG